jgi:hypothetical protein
MKGILIKAAIGVMLFVGSVVGGLAVTGRLNHEGVANIPVLSALFPPPPESHGEGAEGHDKEPAEPEPIIRVVDSGDVTLTEAEAKKPAGGGHGEEAPAEAAHGADPHGAADKAHELASKGDPYLAKVGLDAGKEEPTNAPPHEAEHDFDKLEVALAQERAVKYAPGRLFRFDGLPADLTPEAINQAWQRVEAVMQSLEQRRVAMDLEKAGLLELAADVGQRQRDLAAARTQIEGMQAELDRRIAKFEQDIKLVKADEAAALKKNAQTYNALESKTVAEILQNMWKTEAGQTEMLKVMEFMDKDAVNSVLAELPTTLIQDVLQKRTRVVRGADPAGPQR